jgi:hypothetical protein
MMMRQHSNPPPPPGMNRGNMMMTNSLRNLGQAQQSWGQSIRGSIFGDSMRRSGRVGVKAKHSDLCSCDVCWQFIFWVLPIVFGVLFYMTPEPLSEIRTCTDYYASSQFTCTEEECSSFTDDYNWSTACTITSDLSTTKQTYMIIALVSIFSCIWSMRKSKHC